MDTYEENNIRQHYSPYLIADVIGFLVAVGLAFDEKTIWMGLVAIVIGAPFGAILFRTSVVCYRLLNAITGGLFMAGCLMWIIGGVISLVVPAGVISVILTAMGGVPIGTNSLLILLEIVSLCFIYTDIARVYTDRMVKLPSVIQTVVIVACIILSLVSGAVCIFANLA